MKRERPGMKKKPPRFSMRNQGIMEGTAGIQSTIHANVTNALPNSKPG